MTRAGSQDGPEAHVSVSRPREQRAVPVLLFPRKYSDSIAMGGGFFNIRWGGDNLPRLVGRIIGPPPAGSGHKGYVFLLGLILVHGVSLGECDSQAVTRRRTS